MKLALLSDLHLSTPDAACAFGWTPQRFLDLLTRLEASHDAVALGGDIFDHKVGPGFPFQDKDLQSAKSNWAEIARRLRAPHIHWIHGNNDRLLAREGVPEMWVLEAEQTRLALIHGHQFHKFYQVMEEIKYPFKALASWDLRHQGGRLGKTLYRVNEMFSQPGEDSPRASAAQKGARAMLRRDPDLHIVVCGHNHRPLVEHTPDGIYANSGTCAYGRLDWLSVDMATREVTIHSALDGSST